MLSNTYFMVDIITTTSYLRLQCLIIPELNFLLPVRTPTHDHSGEQVEDQAPYVHYDDIEGQHFYQVFSNCRDDYPEFAFTMFTFSDVGGSRCLPPTARHLPELGFKPGEIIWVSREAIRKYGESWKWEMSHILVQQKMSKLTHSR